MINVAEIFGPTIQGEGPNVGVKTLFVRVVGCDFSCSWCDSKFAWKCNESTISITEDELVNLLIERSRETKCSHIVLTGGNPCLYNFEEVILKLSRNNIYVDIETQGSILPEWLELCDQIVISPKAPSSKQKDVYDSVYSWLQDHQDANIAIKIPVFDDIDFDFARKYYKLTQDFDNVKLYLSVGNTNTSEAGDISSRVLRDYQNLIDRVMASELDNVYVLPQIHTLVWGNKQGV